MAELWTFAEAAFLILGSIVAAKVVFFILDKVVMRMARKTKTEVDDQIVKAIEKPVYIAILMYGILYSLNLVLPAEYLSYTGLGITVTTYIIAIWLAIKISNILIGSYLHALAKKTESDFDDELVGLFKRFSKFFIFVVGAIVLLGELGVEITPLVASMGIAGLAIALALQDTLSNFFSGIYLVFDRPFKTGDVITLSTGHTGTILKVGTRSAKLRTFDNTIVTIPNAELAKSVITNLSAPDSMIRVKLPIGVAYGSSIGQVKQILEDVAREDPAVVGDPQPAARFMKFNDFSLDFELMLWVDSLDKKLDTVHRINEKINNEFEKAGIEIPFPTRTHYNVNIEDSKGPEPAF